MKESCKSILKLTLRKYYILVFVMYGNPIICKYYNVQ